MPREMLTLDVIEGFFFLYERVEHLFKQNNQELNRIICQEAAFYQWDRNLVPRYIIAKI